MLVRLTHASILVKIICSRHWYTRTFSNTHHCRSFICNKYVYKYWRGMKHSLGPAAPYTYIHNSLSQNGSLMAFGGLPDFRISSSWWSLFRHNKLKDSVYILCVQTSSGAKSTSSLLANNKQWSFKLESAHFDLWYNRGQSYYIGNQ